MGKLNEIATKRRDFIKLWGEPPEVIVLTDDDLSEINAISTANGAGYLFGMEVDFGKETKCKFRDRVELIENFY